MPNNLIGRAVGNLIGGVTQQPRNTRFLNMAEESINAIPSVSRGLDKRPGSTYLATIHQPASVGDSVTVGSHVISRDSNEKYTLVVYRDDTAGTAWSVKAVNLLTGEEVPVYGDTSGAAMTTLLNDYLRPAAAEEHALDGEDDLRFMTVGDTTFLLNRNRIALMQNTLTSVQDDMALVVVRAGVYGQRYGMKLDGSSFQVDYRDIQAGIPDGQTVDGSVAIHARYIAPNDILSRLLTDTNASTFAVSQLTANTWRVRISRTTGGTFKLKFHEFTGGSYVSRTTGNIAYSTNATTLANNIDAALETVYLSAPAVFTVAQTGTYIVGETEDFVITCNAQIQFVAAGTHALTGASGDWAYQRVSNVAKILHSPTQAFTIEPDDANYGTLMEVVRGDVETVDSLPLIAPDGFKVRIAGGNDDGADDWYAEFETEDPAAFGRGTWRESIGWGLKYLVNKGTMPHVFRSYVKSSVGTHPAALSDGDPYFVFENFDWADRASGDDLSNPIPSIFDKRIDALGFHRGRLLMMTGESVTAAEAAAPENLFRVSVASLLDTDRIDMTSQIRDASDFRAFVEHNEKAVLISDNSQVVLDSAGALLTPGTAGLQVAGSAQTDPDGGPVTAGPFIFAPFRRGYISGIAWDGYSGVYQMVDARGGQTLRLEPFDITTHCPEYIRGRIVHMAASTTENMLAVLTDALDTIYIYRWHDEGNQRVQGAWQKLNLAESYGADIPTVLSMAFVESTLYLTTFRDREGMGICVERVEFASGTVDDDLWCAVRLDNKVRHDQIAGTTVVDVGADTVVTFPAGTWKRRGDGATGIVYAVLADIPGQAGGTVYASDAPGGGGGGTSVVLFPNINFSGQEFYIGVAYEMRHTLSAPYMEKQSRTPNGSTTMALVTGRTRVARAFLDVAEAADLKVEVSHSKPGGATNTKQFLHTSLPGVDVIPFERVEQVSISARNDAYTMTIINDSPFASRINGLEYETNHHGRSSRV